MQCEVKACDAFLWVCTFRTVVAATWVFLLEQPAVMLRDRHAELTDRVAR
jgi:hypothetical protein